MTTPQSTTSTELVPYDADEPTDDEGHGAHVGSYDGPSGNCLSAMRGRACDAERLSRAMVQYLRYSCSTKSVLQWFRTFHPWAGMHSMHELQTAMDWFAEQDYEELFPHD